MTAHIQISAGMLCAVLGTLSPNASGCEGPAPLDIPAFIHFRPGHAIFVGTVTATTPQWKKFLGARNASTLRVTKWYLGRHPQKVVTLPHVVPDPSRDNSPCPDMVPRFEGRPGEQWLIVGKAENGAITDYAQYSIRAENGRLPATVMQHLAPLPAGRQGKARNAPL